MDERDDPGAVDPWAGDGDGDWVESADDVVTDDDETAGDSDGQDVGNAADRANAAAATAGGPAADSAASADSGGIGPRRYRVLDRAEGTLVFVDLDAPDPGPGPAPDEGFEPVRVAADVGGDESVAEALADLEPGYVVTATLRWPDSTAGPEAVDDAVTGAAETDAGSSPLARVESLTVDRESRYRFVDDAEPMFEAARDAWRDASTAGDGMGSRVTRDTDGEPNGALYVFSEVGARDLLGEFRSGTTPLEPLVDRVNEDLADGEPREVFVLRPPDGAFVAIYIAFEKDGLLARTVRDTYL
ncbi:DUF6663 family protein [Halobaculum gomorrense]|uniref:Uncharacterized protein n=1 Tax=Halobaculum gomorrense TaxID=43928 RepID=A0A1M5K9D7_9EURY|nr:DUF6663 family protein [Halobaculum gomorrense]SHG49464.1 hypothetical protein SAMN05443636_0425 [Halobaculum gomorrense]